MRILTKQQSRRPGVALMMFMIAIIGILGMVAISLEGGMLLTERRNAQATADAAAFAAAGDLYYNHFTSAGIDINDTAKTAALKTAHQNGYTNDGKRTKVTVNIPPTSGMYAGKASYVEVIVECYQMRGFSSMFGSNKIEVKARAVAVGKPDAANVGIHVLDPSSKNAFNAGGGGNITVSKVPVVVNSKHQEGSVANGGTTVTAIEFDLVGGYTTSGGGKFVGPIKTQQMPEADPLRYLPVPDPTKMTIQSTKKTQYTSGDITLYPGVYVGGITASSTANITLMPGIYYMDGGGFSMTGQGSLTATGVMIYNAPKNGQAGTVQVSASGTVSMSAPTSGMYKGVMFFQERTQSEPASVSGGSNMDITGTFYFANAQLNVTGQGDFKNPGSQYVSKTLNVQGSGKVYVDWDPSKVAQQRLITIVE